VLALAMRFDWGAMALTDNCDVFFAAHENGINRVIGHVATQRPSLFNYGSKSVVDDPSLLCAAVQANPFVRTYQNPLVKQISALQVVGSGPPNTPAVEYLDFGVQVTLPQVDFSPGTIALPAELNPPLPAQHFAASTTVRAGIGCPPGEQFICSSVDAFATGTVGYTSPGPGGTLSGQLDGLDTVDITPAELESAVNCYGRLVVNAAVLPLLEQLKFPYPSSPIDLGFAAPPGWAPNQTGGDAALRVNPSTSVAIPNNPALEDDQIKAFLDLAPTTIHPTAGGSKLSGTPQARVRNGLFDIILALSKPALRRIFDAFRDSFTWGSTSGQVNFGPFILGYTFTAVTLSDGNVDLNNNNTVSISGLDVNVGTFTVCIGFDLGQICTPPICIVPNPLDGCIVQVPGICVNLGTIQACFDLGPLFTAAVSATLTPITKYATNPARAGMDNWKADTNNDQNQWQLYAELLTIAFDYFDIADGALQLLVDAVTAAIDAILAPFPSWVQDFVNMILGPIEDLVVTILDLPADFGQWLFERLSDLRLPKLLLNAITEFLAPTISLAQVTDPIKIASGSTNPPDLLQILIPLEFVGVSVTADELIVQVDIADPT
jgi:hypothetical protein